MASFITAGNATNGLQVSSDNTGILELKSGTGSGTTAVTVNASQNVGIGTTTPNQRLNVIGNLGVGSNGVSIGAGREVYIDCPAASTGALDFSVNGTLTGYLSSSSTSTNLYTFGASPVLLFGTNNTERARIDSSGNFLVGTTSTTANPRAVIYGGASTGFIELARAGTTLTDVINFINANGIVGTIRTTGSNTQYNTSSDYRLKENVQPMTGALAKVGAMKPCTYTWKVDGESGEGFIAHELAEVCPGAVSGNKDAVNEDGSIKPQGIDTSFLVATLTAAIQEQQAMIDEMKAEIAALKGAA
jgi:hypothetical protein